MSVSSWVLSVAGICLLSVMLENILPDGKTQSQLKKVIKYMVVVTVILPLPKLFNSEISLDSFLNNSEIIIQDEYIYNINQSKLESWQESIILDLEEKGILGVTVSISANIFEKNMIIDAVYVDLYNMVISDDLKNINIKTEVVNVIMDYVDVKEGDVVFNG